MTRSPAMVEALLGDERAEEGKNEEERSLVVVGGSDPRKVGDWAAGSREGILRGFGWSGGAMGQLPRF